MLSSLQSHTGNVHGFLVGKSAFTADFRVDGHAVFVTIVLWALKTNVKASCTLHCQIGKWVTKSSRYREAQFGTIRFQALEFIRLNLNFGCIFPRVLLKGCQTIARVVLARIVDLIEALRKVNFMSLTGRMVLNHFLL